ncbi:MAG: UMP kinase [Clostridiales bacterium]|nr:UMP kinase [Clostridiales bacterium]
MSKAKYERILLKLSGEALSGEKGFGIDADTVIEIVKSIEVVYKLGVQIAIVVGAGNFWRGRDGQGMDRSTADHMGMLGTVINSLALQDAIEKHGIPTRVMTAIPMDRIAEPYIKRKAVSHLENNEIVIFACGTGNPFFSTDTAAALRAAEIDADIILFAKNVDGIYSADPNKNPDAVKYDTISYHEVLMKKLAAIDLTATSLCLDNEIPSLLFALEKPSNIVDAVLGNSTGTFIEK